MSDPAMIQVAGLKKHFETPHGRVDVLRGIDLAVSRGERLAVVGASGSGKSTFMHLVGGLDQPSAGQVEVDGLDVFGLDDAARDGFRNRTVGFVFQFHHLLPEFTALENVMLPAMIGRVPKSHYEKNATELLKEVGLGHRLSHKPGALSGGEQQRVAIARALSLRPKVLLADEPTGNLDSRSSDDTLQLLDRLHKNHQLTMIVVTHSHALAASLDRTIRMEDGQLKGPSIDAS